MHYWSVWHEGKPFSAYYEVTPAILLGVRLPVLPLGAHHPHLRAEKDLNVTSPVMEHHQRHPRGNSIITEMFTRYFRVPEGFENFVYLSQVQQALAIKTAVEYWRTLRPLCMGTLYWQLNDNWPVCSWSSVEYDGTWKLLHYAARRFFAPVLLCAWMKNGQVEVRLVNDLPVEARCNAVISVIDFSGKVLSKESLDVRAPAGSSKKLKAWSLQELVPPPDAAFLHLSLLHDGETTVNELFLTEPKRVHLASAAVKCEAGRDGGRDLRPSSPPPRRLFTWPWMRVGSPESSPTTASPSSPARRAPCASRPGARWRWTSSVAALSVRHLRDTYI